MAGFSTYDPGGCGCPGCAVTFLVRGCNAVAYPGVVASVYDHAGGTLLASGTTDGTGHVALSWAGGPGSYYVTVTGQSARFAASAQTLTLTCGGATTISLAPAAGYACWSATCLQPVKTALNVTVIGPFGTQTGTATYQAGGGFWEWVYTDPGTGNTFIADFAAFGVTATWENVASTNCNWSDVTTMTCPPSFAFGATNAPTDGCVDGSGAFGWTGWTGSLNATE
jgi:hypothetical protein